MTAATRPRCRTCNAVLAPGADWCSQCYTPTREPEPEPPVQPVVQRPHQDLMSSAPSGMRLDSGADAEFAALSGRSAAHPDDDAPAPEADERAGQLADRMITDLASETTDPYRQSALVRAMQESAGVRWAVAGGVAVGLTFVLWLLMLLVGALL